MKVRELAKKYGIELGCIDNSCWFGSPGGMGTNGGCRCFNRGLGTHEEWSETRAVMRKMIDLLTKVADAEIRE